MITPARIVVVVALALLAIAWWMPRSPAPATSAPVSTVGTTPDAAGGERRMPTGCDPLPVPPPLPSALTPATPTVEGVVQALDATLTDQHKAFLRCFPNEDDLVARVHGGLGRWLRNTLHLFSDNPLTASLRTAGVTNADQMSGVILRAYARTLNGQPINIPDIVLRTKAPFELTEAR